MSGAGPLRPFSSQLLDVVRLPTKQNFDSTKRNVARLNCSRIKVPPGSSAVRSQGDYCVCVASQPSTETRRRKRGVSIRPTFCMPRSIDEVLIERNNTSEYASARRKLFRPQSQNLGGSAEIRGAIFTTKQSGCWQWRNNQTSIEHVRSTWTACSALLYPSGCDCSARKRFFT